MWRMYIDFRALKKIIVKNCYPLPIIDDLLDQLKNVVYFTKLDLRSGYHHIIIVEGEKWMQCTNNVYEGNECCA
jgi:hypothetical protein